MIYFIKQLSYVKIGCTDNIRDRLPTLQVSTPERISVIGLVDGDFYDEKKFHQMFGHLHSHGEWFKLSEELERYIESLPNDLMWKHGFLKNDKEIIGLIKKCRLDEHLSLDELGEMMGVTKQSVSEMEIREVQGSISIKSLIKALNVMGYNFETRAVKKQLCT